MMAGNTPGHELERLYKLIQQERLEEAAAALRVIVRTDRDNEDAWWLLANAVTDPSDAKEALQNVVRLNPGRQDAQNLLAQLNSAFPNLIPLAPEAMNFNPGDIGDPFRPITTPGQASELEDVWLPEMAGSESALPSPGAFDDLDDFEATPAATSSNIDPLDDWLAAPQGSSAGSTTSSEIDDWMSEAQPATSSSEIDDWMNEPTPAAVSSDNLDWLNDPQPASATPDSALDDWMKQAQPASDSSGETDVWMPKETQAVDDPFGLTEEDKQPDFVGTPKAAPVSPRFDAPEFFPENFENVLPVNPATPAGAITQPKRSTTTTAPVRAGDVPTTKEDEDEAPNRLIPILMAAMLVIVIGIAGYYIITGQLGGTPGASGTVLPTFPTSQANLPTIDPNATLPTSPFAGATETILPTAAGSETPGFVNTSTGSETPAPDQSATATLVDAGVTLTATAISDVSATPDGAGITPDTATITPDAAVTNAVSTPDAATTVIPTIAPAAAPLAESLTPLTEAFKTAGFADASLNIGESILGKTLTVTVCSRPGLDLVRATDRARDVIATAAAPFRAELEAVGVQINNCAAADTVLYSKVVPIRVATQYAEKRIDARRYRAAWTNP